jgi:hypothetical protein
LRAKATETVIVIVIVAVVIGVWAPIAHDRWRRFEERGYGRDDRLRRVCIVFKMYANESKGEMYPPPSPIRGVFRPNLPDLQKYLDASPEAQELTDCLTGEDGIETCYLGFNMPTEEAGLAVLDRYQAAGPERFWEDDIHLDKPIHMPHFGVCSDIYRLREGVERFFITEIMAPAASSHTQSELPILWEIPNPPRRRGGWVLYMDGHCEWREYPGEFPMTEPFIERIGELMASAETDSAIPPDRP